MELHVDVAAAEAAEQQLCRDLAAMGRVAVAFSAGVDSTYLLAVAHAVLGDKAWAVTADSASMARSSFDQASEFCRQHGIRHDIVATDEFSDESYLRNDGLRCYACKQALLKAMHGLLQHQQAEGQALLIGAVADDFSDYRPGLQAAREAGARWPLADAGIDKAMVRYLSRRRGLSTWDRPAEPCLSSRIPYGERVDRSKLAMIEAAEAILHQAGFTECRARHHQVGAGPAALCRIEVTDDRLADLIHQRHEIEAAIQAVGYAQVTVDLAGLKSGGFNALLSDSERAQAIGTVS